MFKKVIVALVALCCCCGSNAFAENAEKRQCLKDVQTDYGACQKSCTETKKDSKVSCGANPECHKACSADLDSCLEPLLGQAQDCKKSCTDTFEAAKTACKATTQCTNECWKNQDFLSCIRPAGVTRYNCHEDCKDAERLNTTTQDAIKACREAAKTCHKACNVKATPTPTPAPQS